MATPILQPTFTGGELSPSLYARVDLNRYGTSVRTGKNFIVRPYGGLVNRPGFGYVGSVKAQSKRPRLLPFEFSTEVAYVMEFGEGYIRFIYRGAYVLAATSTAWSSGTTYAAGALVLSGGIVYRSLQNGNTNHAPASSPSWWQPNPLAEVAISYTESQLRELAITQSADVVYIAHQSHQPIEIRRVSANTFEVRDFQNKNGPFGPINADEAVTVAVSAELGNVTIQASANIFKTGHVGSLFYVEEKDLRGQRPWEAGWRNVGVGTLCRSDGKVYRAVTIPSGSPTWYQTGGIRPVHDMGRAWDGPQDQRTAGTDTYKVGVEWEYLHSGFGIVLITGYTDANTVTGIVTSRIPASCVGGIGSPGTTWTISADGFNRTYAIAGAVSDSELDYTVTINGVGVQSNPFYQPPPGIGGGDRPGGGRIDQAEP